MIDSTSVTLPAADAFLSGKLEMPQTISPGGGYSVLAWADHQVNSISVIVFTILALITLKSFLNILPHLLDSFSRWKGCVTIESSIRLKSDRNLIGYISILPIALVADKYRLFTVSLVDSIPDEWHFFGTFGIVIAWLTLRYFFYSLCAARARKPETFRTAHSALSNFLILMAAVMIVTAGIISITNISDQTGRTVLIYISAFLYLVSLLRERQILNSYCSHFQTFLYLCALEMFPLGALISANILL